MFDADLLASARFKPNARFLSNEQLSADIVGPQKYPEKIGIFSNSDDRSTFIALLLLVTLVRAAEDV